MQKIVVHQEGNENNVPLSITCIHVGVEIYEIGQIFSFPIARVTFQALKSCLSVAHYYHIQEDREQALSYFISREDS